MTSPRVCRERDELEKRISAVVHEMSQNSKAAGKLATHEPAGGAQAFDDLHARDIVLAVKLQILRECLRLHEDCHGCMI
jgi:hypothetical protein